MSSHICQRCGTECLSLPIPPLYSLADAALMVPMRLSTLQRSLTRYRADLDPPMYTGSFPRRRRLLSVHDLIVLRGKAVTSEYRRRKSFIGALRDTAPKPTPPNSSEPTTSRNPVALGAIEAAPDTSWREKFEAEP